TLYNLVEGAKERRAARRGGTRDAASLDSEPQPALVGAAVGAASGGGEPVVETRRERRAREAGVAAVSVPMIEEDPDIEVPLGDESDTLAEESQPEQVDEDDSVEAFVPESVQEPVAEAATESVAEAATESV